MILIIMTKCISCLQYIYTLHLQHLLFFFFYVIFVNISQVLHSGLYIWLFHRKTFATEIKKKKKSKKQSNN